MAESSKIEWTDATWNPITGCSVTSPGCTNCYAMRLAGTRLQHHPSRAGLTLPSKSGPVWTGEVRKNDEWLEQPLRWKRPRRIFVCAHSDLFHEAVPGRWIDDVFDVMSEAWWHTFQVLTKRSQRMRDYMAKRTPRDNVWLGVSVEDQRRTFRLDDLRTTRARTRFVSFEPLLEDLGQLDLLGIDLAITGGESGPGHRYMDPDWARSILRQCEQQGVARFHKQMSGKQPIPPDLMIREFPA